MQVDSSRWMKMWATTRAERVGAQVLMIIASASRVTGVQVCHVQ